MFENVYSSIEETRKTIIKKECSVLQIILSFMILITSSLYIAFFAYTMKDYRVFLIFAVPTYIPMFGFIWHNFNKGNNKLKDSIKDKCIEIIFEDKEESNLQEDNIIESSNLWQKDEVFININKTKEVKNTNVESIFGLTIRKLLFNISRVKYSEFIKLYVISNSFLIWILFGMINKGGIVANISGLILTVLILTAPAVLIIYAIRLTVLNGFIAKIKLNKKIESNIYIVPDNIEKKIGFYSKYLQGKFKGKKLVKMEDIRFEKEYAVYADNELDARYVLTTKVMEILTEFKQKSSADVIISVMENDMYIAINIDKTMKKIKLFKHVDNRKIENVINSVSVIKNIESELKI
ncbi:MAG: DUF3137 domain-containing protein [Clostridia bacterium]|jgi:hypothetical protein|nr:DUF3137 domain-containing protein [Clostridia bacterium]